MHLFHLLAWPILSLSILSSPAGDRKHSSACPAVASLHLFCRVAACGPQGGIILGRTLRFTSWFHCGRGYRLQGHSQDHLVEPKALRRAAASGSRSAFSPAEGVVRSVGAKAVGDQAAPCLQQKSGVEKPNARGLVGPPSVARHMLGERGELVQSELLTVSSFYCMDGAANAIWQAMVSFPYSCAN